MAASVSPRSGAFTIGGGGPGRGAPAGGVRGSRGGAAADSGQVTPTGCVRSLYGLRAAGPGRTCAGSSAADAEGISRGEVAGGQPERGVEERGDPGRCDGEFTIDDKLLAEVKHLTGWIGPPLRASPLGATPALIYCWRDNPVDALCKHMPAHSVTPLSPFFPTASQAPCRLLLGARDLGRPEHVSCRRRHHPHRSGQTAGGVL